MLLSEMFGVERGEWFKSECDGKALYKISAVEDNIEFLEVNYGGEQGWEFAKMNRLLCVISSAPSGIIHLPPPLTDEQREQLKTIWMLGGRWLAKDKSGEVFTLNCKPEKNSYLEVWLPPNVLKMKCNLRRMYGLDVCSLVSWSDLEPYDIGKALGVTE